MSSISTNPEIELIIEKAVEKAAYHNHEYVTLEHLLYALANYQNFNIMLNEFGADVNGLIKDLHRCYSVADNISRLSMCL